MCKTKYCTKPEGKGTKGFCYTCRSRNVRKANPIRAAYENLRQSVKRRGHEFTITFEYFTQFCREYDYIRGKGKTAKSLSVDRIDNTKGYIPGNLRAIPLGENSRKGTKILHYDWETKYAAVTTHDNRFKDEWFDE